MTYQVIYSSKASTNLSQEDLENILKQAVENNSQNNITGILVYVDGVFLQILEGESSKVLELAERICSDARHSDVKIFSQIEVDHRLFDEWAMAYVDIDKEKLANWLGMDGSISINEVTQNIEAKAHIFPDYIKSIFKTVASS